MQPKQITLTIFTILITVFLGLQPVISVQAAPTLQETVPAAVTYLQSQQQTDGGLPGQSGSSDISTTARALTGFQSNSTGPGHFFEHRRQQPGGLYAI